ncbi:MAG: CYTH domain-containing protein [Corallococcus sp.]|nr:CYTH domain-containing protein [Corallococcus sp.]MCM1359795.1 CYTH domain-containing protein [Corallococcus sp.]MCM1395679.1 CYTH domain-containing protein [Corallococcus sp.]
MRNLEQELKLSLDEREYGILSALSNNKPQLQVNYYFVSQHLGDDCMVRLRQKGNCYILCYKKRLQNSDGVTVCDERECEVDAAFARTLIDRGVYPREINGMLKTDLYEVLTCVGQLHTYRTVFSLQEWTLELDKNEYLGRTDYELECECNHIQQLYKLKNYLSYNYGVVMRYSLPKSQRFFEEKARQSQL